MKKTPSILGSHAPWSWAIEPVRGCNLRCGHCATRLFPGSGTMEGHTFISETTWVDLFRTIRAVTPASRVEMANAGEPTLHPQLPAFIRVARKLSPESQIQVTTNGTQLIKGSLTYRELFDAGLNIVYTDMYAPRDQHERLARESGVQWYFYHDKPKDAPGAWEYHSPEFKLITLMENPARWPESRKKKNRLGTFFNNLDWKAAQPFGLVPVTEPLQRGCTQPFRYVSVDVFGRYELCCQDFMGETAGTMGSVREGRDGFLRFWFGELMQGARRELRRKNRAAISQCARCSITFSRSEMLMWNGAKLDQWWDGKEWQSLPELPPLPEKPRGGEVSSGAAP